MVKAIGVELLSQCVDIAFMRNSQPESNCAYCSNSKESIYDDFKFIIGNSNCLIVGLFVDENFTGFLGCFLNKDKNWVDCLGPFFNDKWNHDYAKEMFQFAKTKLNAAERFNFYFNVKNQNYHQLMEMLSAERKDNEYILLLNKTDYKQQFIQHRVVKLTKDYEAEVIKLHDDTFHDVYVTGKDIINTVNKTREVFCALDDEGAFSGYGVLKYSDDSKRLTAEIFAVKKEKRGKGYGWALLNSVVDSAFRNHNGAAVYLVVDKLNANARALYYACGFKLSVENEAFCIKI